MEAFLVGWSRLAWGAWRQQHYHTLPRCSSARYSTALKVAGGSSKDGRDHILVVTGESERESHRTGTLLAEASASNKGASVRGGRSSQNERSRREPGIPRTEKMEVDQDWTSVYPAAAAFKPSAVPLPIRMGYPVKRGVPPVKDGNLELVKIPNFLHLTPVAIRKHCAALKDFCTEWPTVLNNEEKCMQHFPIEVDTVDYVSAGPSVRNPKARVVTLRIKLSSLNLDDHAKKKLIKLLGERYSKGTDTLTITTDRCPLRRQNYDYAVYLLTVLFHESWKTEQWEKDKTEADMEEYVWENSASEKNALDTLLRIRSVEKAEEVGREELLASEIILSYKNAIVALRNEGENEKSLSQYKNSVKKLLNINSL